MSISCYFHGGPFYDIKLLTKWGMWSTWFTILLGLYSTKAPPKDFMNRKYKNSVCQAWKWHIVFFQISATTEVIETIIFWPVLYSPTPIYGPFKNSAYFQVSKVIDHYLPLVILIIDYILSSPAFVLRHLIFSFSYGLLFMISNMIVSLAGDAPYKFMDWSSVVGVLTPLAVIIIYPLVHYILFWLTRKRL